MSDEPPRGLGRRLLGFPRKVARAIVRHKYALAITASIIFVLMLGAGTVAYHYWSSPEFCKQCHFMEPYYESWKTSSHKHVRCVDCHFEPGLGNELKGKWVAIKQLASVLTGSYSSKPYAEISDAACMRLGCHTERLLEGRTQFTKRRIAFDHRHHLGELRRGIRLTCTSCHSQMVIGSHMQVTQSTCFLCHFKGLAGPGGAPNPIGRCGVCHGPPSETLTVAGWPVDHKGFVERGMECTRCHADVIAGTGEATRDRCFGCHNDPKRLAGFDHVEDLHVNHITVHKITCSQCHGDIEHKFNTRLAQTQHESCRPCHSGSHSVQGDFYAGRGGRGVPETPDPMCVLGIACSGCHTQPAHDPAEAPFTGQTFVAGHLPCISCHGDRYTKFVGAFEKGLGTVATFVDAKLAHANQALASGPSDRPGAARAYKGIADATHNLRLVRAARGIHNPFYAVALLRHADRDLDAAIEAVTAPAFAAERPLGLAEADCLFCHDALPRRAAIPLKDGREFPHAMHEETMACADCHAGAHPPRVGPDAEVCTTCHPK